MTYSPFSHCHSKYYEWCMTTWLFCSWMTTNLLSVEWLTSVFSVLNCWPASQWPLKQNAKYFPPWTFITHIGATCVPLNMICDSGPSDAVFSFGNMSIVVPPPGVSISWAVWRLWWFLGTVCLQRAVQAWARQGWVCGLVPEHPESSSASGLHWKPLPALHWV